MKIAPLAALVATLPLLAQAAEPQASSQEVAPKTAATAAEQQAAKQKPAKQEPAKQEPDETAKPHHSWWKSRAPRPVADRTVVRAVPKPAAKPAAKQSAATPAAPESEPTPKAKKGVFGTLGRVFGGDRQAPPTGRATVRRALPAPKNVAAPKATPKPAAKTSKPAATTRTAAAPETKKPAAEAPKEATQQVATAPKPPKPAKKSAASSTPPAPTKPAVDEELALPGDTALPQSPASASPATPPAPPAATAEFNRKNYLETKQKAAADPAVAALGKKLESASSGEAHKTAARSYTKALFKKMHELDSSQPEWYQRMEAATMRRIDSGKPIVAE